MSAAEVKILESRAQSYRDYPIELKASAVAAVEANGGNVTATAKLFANIPYDTLYYWWKNSDRYFEIKNASSLHLVDKLDNIVHKTADSLAEHDLSIVSAKDKASIISSLTTTTQLLKGLPTSITQDTQRSELLIVMQSAMESIEPEGFIEAESKQLPDNAG